MDVVFQLNSFLIRRAVSSLHREQRRRCFVRTLRSYASFAVCLCLFLICTSDFCLHQFRYCFLICLDAIADSVSQFRPSLANTSGFAYRNAGEDLFLPHSSGWRNEPAGHAVSQLVGVPVPGLMDSFWRFYDSLGGRCLHSKIDGHSGHCYYSRCATRAREWWWETRTSRGKREKARGERMEWQWVI